MCCVCSLVALVGPFGWLCPLLSRVASPLVSLWVPCSLGGFAPRPLSLGSFQLEAVALPPCPTAMSPHGTPLEAAIARLTPDLLRRFPLVQPDWGLDIDTNESWLMHNDSGIGCKACAACRQSGANNSGARAFATFACVTPSALRVSNLRKHHTTNFHKRNVLQMLNVDQTAGVITNYAPPALAFKQVWDNLVSGTSPAAGVEAVGKGTKIRKMAWCLAEGIRIIDRRFLATSTSISLKRDERDQRLLIRFAATNAKLESRRGTLGQCRDFGTRAEAITNATARIITKLCTPLEGAPLRSPAEDLATDEALQNHIKEHIHQVAVDAAGDEAVSARQMREGVNHDGLNPLGPNVVGDS